MSRWMVGAWGWTGWWVVAGAMSADCSCLGCFYAVKVCKLGAMCYDYSALHSGVALCCSD